MKIIDENDTIGWLSEAGVAYNSGKLSLDAFPAKSHISIPVDSGQKTKIAAIIALLCSDYPESLLWINEFGIWPSCEDWNLFNGFRNSLGEDSLLYQKPGHIFSKKDIGSLRSLLAMVLYFFWGAVVVPRQMDFLVKISHDEYIDVYAKDEGVLSSILDKLNFVVNDK